MSFSFQLTNKTAAQCLNGQDAIITVAQTQQAQLANLAIGNTVVVSSSGNTGYVSEIDVNGYTFRAKPQYRNTRMDSVTPGILSANEIVTITQ